jgi:site-specific DNA recombinase
MTAATATGHAPAFAYIRMSTDKQDKSPEQQRGEIERLASNTRHQVARWFEDPGITGDSLEERPQFCEMLRLVVLPGQPKTILLWDLARFGRQNPFKQGAIVAPLVDAGVSITTCAEGRIPWDEFAGQMMFMLHAGSNHKYLTDLSRNTTRGKASRIREGSFIAAAPFGMCKVFYDASGKEVGRAEHGERFPRANGWSCRLAPTSDPARQFELNAIIWAFYTYARTPAGLVKISRDLRERGLVGRNGCPITSNSVLSILRNQAYAGTLAAGKSRRGKYHRLGLDGTVEAIKPGSVPNKKPAEAAVEIRGAHDALIAPDIYEAVQARLRRHAGRLHTRKNVFLLSGVLRCGTCGTPMHGHYCQNHSGRVENLYYVCRSWQSKLGCTTFRGAEIEAYVWKLLDALVTSPGAKDRICAAIKRQIASPAPETTTGQVRHSLDEIDRRIAIGRRNLFAAEKDDAEPMKAMLQELKEQKKRLEKLLRQQAPAGRTELSEKAAVAMIDGISERLRSADKRIAAELIREIFEGITVYRRKIGTRCYFLRGKAVLRSTSGPLAPLALHRSIEQLRQSNPVLQRIEAVALK